jgi:Mn2+/Fe2+ NRAMP family transporter
VLPLIALPGSKAIMGEFQNGPVTRIVAYATTTVILISNGALLVLTLAN